MNLDELQSKYDKICEFLVAKYNLDLQDPNLKYKQMVKLQEELGELSEQILKSDNQQRVEKGAFADDELLYEYFDVLSTMFVFGRMLEIDIAKGFPEKVEQIMQKHGVV